MVNDAALDALSDLVQRRRRPVRVYDGRWDDGNLLNTLTRAGPSAGDRARGEQALGRSVAVARLTDSLKKGRPTDAIDCLGFVVRQP
jgi:hypothetical protein